MPVILAAGQRWCRRAVMLPGPQPRSAMYSIFSSGTLAAAPPPDAIVQRQSADIKRVPVRHFYSRQRVTPIVDKTDKFASRHHPIEQTFLRGPVIKITDSGSQRSHRIRMCFLNPPFIRDRGYRSVYPVERIRCVSRLTLSSLKDKTDNILKRINLLWTYDMMSFQKIYSPTQLANAMKLVRQQNGWTQSELAKKSALSRRQFPISKTILTIPRSRHF